MNNDEKYAKMLSDAYMEYKTRKAETLEEDIDAFCDIVTNFVIEVMEDFKESAVVNGL